MKRINKSANYYHFSTGYGAAFSFSTHKPESTYPFNRLYALKPKNPV